MAKVLRKPQEEPLPSRRQLYQQHRSNCEVAVRFGHVRFNADFGITTALRLLQIAYPPPQLDRLHPLLQVRSLSIVALANRRQPAGQVDWVDALARRPVSRIRSGSIGRL
jgi:hypothetical protein